MRFSENSKIILSVLVAFVFIFSLLVTFLNQYSYSNTFYSQHFDPKIKKVFLLGSSYVGYLNTTLINEKISDEHQDYIVYNLAYGDDHPRLRIATVNQIIATKPEAVFYGISYRDFANFDTRTLLPDPHQVFVNLGSNLGFDYLQEFPNPIRASISVFQNALSSMGLRIAETNFFEPNTPFFSYPPGSSKIENFTEMKKLLPGYGLDTMQILPARQNQELSALETVVTDLQKHNIRVVVFATPVSRVYLDGLSEKQKDAFNSILGSLSTDTGVKIYNLTDKYADLPIWVELGHVAYNKNSAIYSRDVARMISDEIGP